MNLIALNDIGTTNVKSIIQVENQEYILPIFPTAIGPARPLEFGSGEGLAMDGQDYFIGDIAISHSPNLIWGRDAGWLMSDWYKRLHLYCVARGISQHVDRLKNSHQAYTHLLNEVWSINLVTAVPYANWDNRLNISLNIAGQIEDGKWAFPIYEISALEHRYPIKIKFNVETVKSKKDDKKFLPVWPRIALQGWSAYLANPTVPNPDKPNVVVIGLGGRNIVYCTMRLNGTGQYKPVDGLVGSKEDGILKIVETLISQIERQYKIELNHQQGIQALKSGKVADYDISNLVDEITKPYIDSVLSLISERWNERQLQPFVSEIRLTGGGAILLGERIKHKLVTVDNDPLWSEVVGMKAVLE